MVFGKTTLSMGKIPITQGFSQPWCFQYVCMCVCGGGLQRGDVKFNMQQSTPWWVSDNSTPWAEFIFNIFRVKCQLTSQLKPLTPPYSPTFSTVTHLATVTVQMHFWATRYTFTHCFYHLTGSQHALVHGSDPLAVVIYHLEQPLQFCIALPCTCKTRDQRNVPLSGIVPDSQVFDAVLTCQEPCFLFPL